LQIERRRCHRRRGEVDKDPLDGFIDGIEELEAKVFSAPADSRSATGNVRASRRSLALGTSCRHSRLGRAAQQAAAPDGCLLFVQPLVSRDR
jgi:hypothetical protein